MRSTLVVSLVLALLRTDGAFAQIGKTLPECLASSGRHVSGKLDAQGAGTLQFEHADLRLAIDFVAGTAQRIVYRAPTLDDAAVKGVLDANRDGKAWQDFVPPGLSAGGGDGRQWMRSDELAMARLERGALTILGANWYPSQAGSPAAQSPTAETNPAPASPAPQPVAAEAPVRLPAKGDSMAEVVRLLGQPTSTLAGGTRRVLVYPWGRVWVADGIVADVQESQ